MVRAIHHAADAPAVLRGVSRILSPGGTLVLEFANKRNLKAILRYLLRLQQWSPFAREPIEFAELNFDFHPVWMKQRLAEAGLAIRSMRTVSHFRLALLKRLAPTALLVTLDRLLQPTGSLCQVSPSIFVRCSAPADAPPALPGAFFRCTLCDSTGLEERGETLSCTDCGARFPLHDRGGIYDFRASIGGGTV
jgi:hypothetical protein